MAGPKIGFGEAFEGDFIKQMNALNKEFKKFLITYKALIKESKDNKELIQAAKSLNEFNKAAKKTNDTITKLTATEKEQARILKATEQATIKAAQATTKQGIALSKANEQKRRATAESKRLAKAQLEAATATTKLGRSVGSFLARALSNSNKEKRRASAESKKLANAQLGAAKSTNKFGVAIKSFLFKANFLANVMSNLASTIGRAFVRAVRGAFTVVKDFDGAVANLAAISGKTREEIAGLTKQAKELGSVTKFTATQIVGLQTELAKLGFTSAEISASTEAISDFAAATGTDLAQSAKIVGVALRVFGLGANEAADAAASLAIATTKSGLVAQQYETILSSVGPVARAYGFTLEDITAITGALVTKGFEANKAATATRNIFLKLADAGGALSKEFGNSVTDFDSLIKAMARLNDEGVDLGTMLELTDVRSVAAFSALLDGAESTNELRDSIEDVNEQLEEMVETQLDSLPGDIDLLKSAWEGLILTLSKEGGVFRNVVQFLTNAVLQVSNLNLAVRRFSRQSTDQLSKSFDVLEALTNKQGEHFSQMIDFFDEMTDEQLLSRGIEQMSKDFALIRNVSRKGGLALAEEYLRRREETIATEVQAEKDKQIRITKDAEKQTKARESILRREKKAEEQKAEEKRTKAKEEARKLLNEAYAESVRLLDLIEPPKDLEELLQIDADQAANIASIIEGSLDDVDLDFSWFSDAFEDEEEDTVKTVQSLWDKLFQIGEAQRKRTKAANDKEAKERLATEESVINSISGLATEGLNVFTNINQRKINDLDNRLDQGLISEEAYQREINSLNKKQDALQKIQAIFSIGINTAVAAMQVAGQTGVGAVVAVPLVLALGAAQIAAVLARPVPQYAKGVDSSPEGLAITGEKGRELKITPKGKMSLTPGKASLDYLQKGTKIVPADITEQFLRYAAVANGFEGKADDQSILMMMDELKGIKQAIKNKPVTSSRLTPEGILTATHLGNTTLIKRKRFYT
jgi:TP901 family phage tail tape measure protein